MTESPSARNGTQDELAPDGNAMESAGAMLRRLREAQGLHIAALAVSLKIPVRKLEALEADRHDLLTDAVFTRGLASSVCRALKVDAEPVLSRLPLGTAPRLVAEDSGLNTVFRHRAGRGMRAWRERATGPAARIVAGLLVAIAGVLWWPNEGVSFFSAGVWSRLESAAERTVPVSAPEKSLLPAMSPGASSAIQTPVTPDPASSSPAVPVDGPSMVGASASSPSGNRQLLVLRAKGLSWVQVVDSTGALRLQKTMSAGETIGFAEGYGLSVVIGRADLVAVEVRGASYDLAPHVRDRVARFEVQQ
ncbi:MAG: DUF4115 domain-containing protein [Rhodoferax sp.]|nr:DUF4115 domain-containing protein [Rhodoferax sp.]